MLRSLALIAVSILITAGCSSSNGSEDAATDLSRDQGPSDLAVLPSGECAPASPAPQHPWLLRLGRRGRLRPSAALVRLDDGGVCQTGVFSGALVLGKDSKLLRLQAAHAWSYYLACWTRDGEISWAKQFGPAHDVPSISFVVDGASNMTLGIFASQTIEVDGRALSAPSGHGLFLISFDKAGTYRWGTVIEGASAQAWAATATGDIFIGGKATGVVRVSGAALSTTPGQAFIASVDKNGAFRFGRPFGVFDGTFGGLVASPSGEVTFQGHAFKPLVLGDGIVVEGGFIAHLDPSGAPKWAKTVVSIGSVGVDCAGNIAVAGYLTRTIDLGAGPLTPQGSSDILLASFTSAGALRWGKTFSSTGEVLLLPSPSPKIVGCQGTISLLVSVGGPIDFGGGPLAAPKGALAVATFDTKGKHSWSRIVSPRRDSAALFVDGDGVGKDTVTVRAWLDDDTDVGGGPLSSRGYRHHLVASFDATGQHLTSFASAGWSNTLPAVGYALEAGGSPTIAIAGGFIEPLELGTHRLTGSHFVAALDAGGQALWVRSVEGQFMDARPVFARGDDGVSVVAGQFKDRAEVDGKVLQAQGDQFNIYIASLDAKGGHRWSKSFGGEGKLYVSDVAIAKAKAGGAGGLVLLGTHTGTVDFGGGPLLGGTGPAIAGERSLYLAAFDAQGNHRWSKALRGYGDGKVSIDEAGNVTILAAFFRQIDLGGGMIESQDLEGVFIASFDAKGRHRWSRGLDRFEISGGATMALDAAGNVVVVGVQESLNDNTSRVMVASFDAAGKHRFSRPICAGGWGSAATGLAISASGEIYLAGSHMQPLVCDGISLPFVAGEYRSRDSFVLALDRGGCLRWIEHLSSRIDDHVAAMAIQGDHLLITGSSGAEVDVGGRFELLQGGFLLALERH